MKNKKLIVLTGGGTAGHIMPNIAIYEQLKHKYDFCYIGSHNSMEENISKKYMSFYPVNTVKLIRKLSLQNFKIPFRLFSGIKQSKKLLKELNPELIFSKGGFVAVPVVLAARKLKIPVITHESDLTLGLANRLIKNSCKYLCTSFEETAKKLKNGVYTGSPLRKSIFNGNREKIIKDYNLSPTKPTIMVIGGSLGSKTINNFVFKNIENFKNYNLIHIVGKGNKNNIKQENYIQIEFTESIQDYYACSDIVITRGGSNVINELLALKKPMLIIPLSKAQSRGDQILNAEYFTKKGYSEMILEEELNLATFKDKLDKLTKSKKYYLDNMKTGFKNGCKEIEKLIDKTIKC